jgi:uncharacterized membrane protein
MTTLLPLLGSIGLGAIAQISLRYGASVRTSRPSGTWRWTALWGLCFAMATALWLTALRTSDISYAYPLLGAGYVFVSVLAKWLLREILIITAGVVMVGVNR